MIDTVWIAVCCGMVFLMQAGFTCLEAGLTRSKNSINVAIKNISDFALSVLVFWAVGYGLMFGESQSGLVGVSHFANDFSAAPHQETLGFLFQAMFCGTAATIVSGIVAERLRYWVYVLITTITAGGIYVVFGHWAWHADGWLAQMGFVDFAGTAVVHLTGAAIGLATIIIVGPRQGRYASDGTPQRIPGSNVPVAILGALLLWAGWLGFNGGSALGVDERLPTILSNTVLGGASGLVAALTSGWWLTGRTRIDDVINGSLAGLVSVTGGCHAFNTGEAIVVGAIGAWIMQLTGAALEKLRADDAISGIPVHAGAGIWGCAAVALFGAPEILSGGRIDQLGIQAIGVLVCFGWAFGCSFAVLGTVNRFKPLRVDADAETVGLNISEHGVSTEMVDLMQVMEEHRLSGDYSKRIDSNPYSDTGRIASLYNQILDRVEEEHANAVRMAEQAQEARAHMVGVNSDLEASNRELQRFTEAATGRELRIVELKRQINDYALRLEQSPPFKVDFE